MIEIKDIQGKVLHKVLITTECVHVCEIIQLDHIELSFNLDSGNSIPAGSYIEHKG